jgi:type IV pilus assembly protein PilY1
MAHRNPRDIDMNLIKTRVGWLGLGALWALTAGTPAIADDTELFVGNNLSSQAHPNILFVLDNSGSMATQVTTQDPTTARSSTRSRGCDPNRIYWRTGVGNPPDCTTDRWFNAAALRCNAAPQAIMTAGYYTDAMAQYDPTTGSGGRRWENITTTQKTRVVECQDDRNVHGDGVDATRRYARNGGTTAGYWGTATQEILWGQTPANETYTIYSGNYLNWVNSATATQTRLEIVQDVATDLLDSVNGVNVGLITYNRNTGNTDNGGYVVYPMEDITTARAPIQAAVRALTPTGFTPLSETLYEARSTTTAAVTTAAEQRRGVPRPGQ